MGLNAELIILNLYCTVSIIAAGGFKDIFLLSTQEKIFSVTVSKFYSDYIGYACL